MRIFDLDLSMPGSCRRPCPWVIESDIKICIEQETYGWTLIYQLASGWAWWFEEIDCVYEKDRGEAQAQCKRWFRAYQIACAKLRIEMGRGI